MTIQTCVIYSSLHPLVEKTVSVNDKAKYLNCKFWKESREEADVFFNFYLNGIYGELHRIVAILGGELFKAKSLSSAYDKISKLILLYQHNPENKTLSKSTSYVKILDAITKNSDYPVTSTLDDVLDWADANKIAELSEINKARKQIVKTREVLFLKNDVDNKKIVLEIIDLCIKKYRYLNYADAKDLLFSGYELMPELKKAFENDEILACISKDGAVAYFDMRSLIKWLMRYDYVPAYIVSEFEWLKVESVKENKKKCALRFDSLSKLIREGMDRDDLINDAVSGLVDIHMKYPRDSLLWRQHITSRRLVNDSRELAACRYDGFGQLKRIKIEDSHRCQFGGFTIDMMVYGEQPCHALSREFPHIECEIEFVPTAEEVSVGLQPFIKIQHKELQKMISEDNLLIFRVLPDLERGKFPQLRAAVKQSKQKRSCALHELLKSIYNEATDKSPRAIWEKLESLAQSGDGTIQEVGKWTAHYPEISWLSHRDNETKTARSTFENIISKIKNGKL